MSERNDQKHHKMYMLSGSCHKNMLSISRFLGILPFKEAWSLLFHMYVYFKIWRNSAWNQDDGKTLEVFPHATKTGSLDTTPFLNSNPKLVHAPTKPTLNKPQHKQKHVVTHSTLGVSTGSLRPTTGCVCTIKHTSVWRTARLSVTLLIQP